MTIVAAAIASLPLKDMEASLLRSAILAEIAQHGLSEPDFTEAIDIASFLHRDQTRKQRGDLPLVHYIEHPLRNTLRALRYGIADPDTLIGIILHDTVEDEPEQFSVVFAQHEPSSEHDAREHAFAFLAQRFGAPVERIVRALSNPLLPTRMDRSQKNAAYVDHVRLATESPAVLVAKFVDFADNALSLHHSRDDVFVARQATKYAPLVEIFTQRLDDVDVLALVGASAVERMKEQLAANRLDELSAADA
jgi:(p)ppGpp synthase/HD superfamily hydrolase